MATFVTFEHDADDVRDMQHHYLWHGKYRFAAFRHALIQLLLVLWALLVAALAYVGHEPIGFWAFVGAAAAFALVAVIWAVAALRLPSSEAARWGKDPYIRQRTMGWQSVEIRDEGLRWTHGVGEGRVAWRAVSAIERGMYGIYFYLGAGQVVSVPSHAFDSAESMARFADQADAYRASALAPAEA